jgi:hypothetical protein
MKRICVALLTVSVSLGAGIAPAAAGPCSDDIAELDRALELVPKPGAKSRPASKPVAAPRPREEQRYDQPLALARELDAKGDPECRKAVTEVKILIGQ